MFDQPSQPVSHHAARCCGGLEDPDEAVVVARRRYGRANAWLIAALGVNDETDILPIQIGERGVLSLSFHFLQLFALYPSMTA